MKFDIVCFGSGLIDIFADTEIPEKGKFICYDVGSKIQIHDLEFAVGGGGVNTSTTFSKMGLSTGFLGRIGGDIFAKRILDKIKESKVKFIGSLKGRTGYSVVLDSKEHDRTILTFKGDNDNFNYEDINLGKIKTKWFYFSGLRGKSFRTQLKIAKLRKYKIAYNPSLYLFDKENVKDMIRHVHILILNKEEADRLSKEHEKILGMGPKILCVTNGKNPFFCYTNLYGDKRKYKIYPNQNTKVIERTGAGDAFASGFVASYIKTNDIVKSLKIGVANSESVVRYKGSTNKILGFYEAERAIKKRGCKVEEIK